VFAIQDEISHGIVEALKLKLSERPLLTRPPVDLEAYNLYLRGRHLSGRLNPESVRIAREYFEQALARDPNYALAYAGLGYLLYIQAVWGQLAPRTVLPDAKRALEKALELDASLPEAHAYLGSVLGFYNYDWVGAESEMKRAMELGPAVAEMSRMKRSRYQRKRLSWMRCTIFRTGCLGWLIFSRAGSARPSIPSNGRLSFRSETRGCWQRCATSMRARAGARKRQL